jgi:hypothetical protein
LGPGQQGAIADWLAGVWSVQLLFQPAQQFPYDPDWYSRTG